MRRILPILLCVLLLGLSVSAAAEAIPASGSGTITSCEITATVNTQGTAQVSGVVKLHLAESTTRLVIPLGKGASNCVVNGVRLSIRNENGIPSVSLRNKDGLIGDLQINMTYQLSKCVNADGILELPVLANSYAYPIEALSFHVTMPGEFAANPTFKSGYLGEDVDNYMEVVVDGPLIHGKLLEPLRDHDSLSMFLETPETMFFRRSAGGTTLRAVNITAAVLGALMVLYWLLRLYWKPVRVRFQSHPPMGETAGEAGALLTGGNISFSLMVISWAQMGYLTIQKGRDVILHKRMDMGNERSELEIQAFNQLFRKRRSVSATGGDFQYLRAKIEGRRPRIGGQFSPSSGNPMVLRSLGVLLGMTAGIGLGDAVLPPMTVRFLPIILFALAGAWGGWEMQAGLHALVSRDKQPVFCGAASLIGFIVLGVMGQQLPLAAACVLLECLSGFATMFGGRRTEDGRRTVQGELGMIRFFRWEYKERLQTFQYQNPSYYYDLAPYALALGADKAFAKRFEKLSLPPCSYLRCPVKGSTAADWYPVLRETVDLMDGKPAGLEKTFLGRLVVAFYIARGESKRSRRSRNQRGSRERFYDRNDPRQPSRRDFDKTRRLDYDPVGRR